MAPPLAWNNPQAPCPVASSLAALCLDGWSSLSFIKCVPFSLCPSLCLFLRLSDSLLPPPCHSLPLSLCFSVSHSLLLFPSLPPSPSVFFSLSPSLPIFLPPSLSSSVCIY